jgi:hypothetical protein
MTKSTSTRRAILAGAATLSALAILPALAVAAEVHPDAALLALGREQEAAHALWKLLLASMDQANACHNDAAYQDAEDEFGECMDRIWRAADKIFALPASTAAGLAVKSAGLYG